MASTAYSAGGGALLFGNSSAHLPAGLLPRMAAPASGQSAYLVDTAHGGGGGGLGSSILQAAAHPAPNSSQIQYGRNASLDYTACYGASQDAALLPDRQRLSAQPPSPSRRPLHPPGGAGAASREQAPATAAPADAAAGAAAAAAAASSPAAPEGGVGGHPKLTAGEWSFGAVQVSG